MPLVLSRLAATALIALALRANDKLPPARLLQEAVGKADAVILAEIQSAQMPPGGFAATTVKIRRVYLGVLPASGSLTYYSFKEQNAYLQPWLEHGVIVFLVSEHSARAKQWGAASEFFEFEYSRALERRVISLLKKRKK